MPVARWIEVMEWQRGVRIARTLLCSKFAFLQTFLVGGMAAPFDPKSQWGFSTDGKQPRVNQQRRELG